MLTCALLCVPGEACFPVVRRSRRDTPPEAESRLAIRLVVRLIALPPYGLTVSSLAATPRVNALDSGQEWRIVWCVLVW